MTAKQFLDYAVTYFQAPDTQTGWGKNKVAEKLKDLYIEATGKMLEEDPATITPELPSPEENVLFGGVRTALRSTGIPDDAAFFLAGLALRVHRLEKRQGLGI